MLGNRKLVLDTHSEIYDLIKPWCDYEFWDFKQLPIVRGAVYVIGRQQLIENIDTIKQLVNDDTIRVIFSNPAEGSETILHHCTHLYGIADLIKSQKMLLIGGGDMDAEWPCLQYDSFLPKLLDYEENLTAILDYANSTVTERPYKFLFLNGRTRPHRKYLLERFRVTGLLDQAIWTNLDSTTAGNREIQFIHNGQDLMYDSLPVYYLDPKYEVPAYHSGIGKQAQGGFVKHALFDNDWGEAYLRVEPYQDTYFSLVTETVYSYPYSFRTEKIWKPIAIGHPFIAVANRGYYRDLRNLGFRTFGHLIDESFDQIDNNQERIERTAAIVEDLCSQDLPSFVRAAAEVCKYNQQHLAHMRQQVRQEFPIRFTQFTKQYKFHE